MGKVPVMFQGSFPRSTICAAFPTGLHSLPTPVNLNLPPQGLGEWWEGGEKQTEAKEASEGSEGKVRGADGRCPRAEAKDNKSAKS
jgi:hypothetical protein